MGLIHFGLERSCSLSPESPRHKQHGYVFGSSLKKKKSLTASRVFTYDLTDRVGIHMSVGMCIITGSVGAHD